MLELLDNSRGIGELDFFDNIIVVWVFELVSNSGGIRKLDFFDNIGPV
jgi:hypothetical protein